MSEFGNEVRALNVNRAHLLETLHQIDGLATVVVEANGETPHHALIEVLGTIRRLARDAFNAPCCNR